MQTLRTHEYKRGKLIADNLQQLLASKYVEISDEEYERIQTALATYNGDEMNEDDGVSSEEFIELQKMVEDLRQEITNNKSLIYDVQQDGLYFVDENGYIVAKIISTGFYAINLDGTGSGSSEQIVTALNDLTDVVITDPANGEALVYNSTASKWKNTSVSGSIAGDFTLVDY